MDIYNLELIELTEDQRFKLNAQGSSLAELLEDLTILEFDEDGEEVGELLIEDVNSSIQEKIYDLIEQEIALYAKNNG